MIQDVPLCSRGQADIKPQNILLHAPDERALDGSTRVTLIDLGSCLGREQLDRKLHCITCMPVGSKDVLSDMLNVGLKRC